MKKGISLVMSLVCCLFVLSGCENGETITIQIVDQNVMTLLDTRSGRTVEDALEEAEISLDEGDEINPSLDEYISSDTEIEISRLAHVTISYDEEEKEITMVGKKVQDALDDCEIVLGENDFINHDLEAYLYDGMKINVIPRVEVSIKADGETNSVLTSEKTVEDLLKSEGITISDDDRVTPSLDTALEDDMNIVVKRVTYEEVVVKESISYGTQYKYSKSIDEGKTKIEKSGQNGSKEVTYRVTYVDGKEESREAIKTVVTKKAVDQVVVKGTKPVKHIISKQRNDDCDGSGHGYYIIKYSDGTIEYQDY